MHSGPAPAKGPRPSFAAQSSLSWVQSAGIWRACSINYPYENLIDGGYVLNLKHYTNTHKLRSTSNQIVHIISYHIIYINYNYYKHLHFGSFSERYYNTTTPLALLHHSAAELLSDSCLTYQSPWFAIDAAFCSRNWLSAMTLSCMKCRKLCLICVLPMIYVCMICQMLNQVVVVDVQ